MPTIRTLALAAAAAATAIALTACQPSGSAQSSDHSAAAALATSTAAQQVKADFAGCVDESDPAAQIALIRKLLTDTKSHPNGSWATLMSCMGISPANRPAFEAAALGAAEHTHLITSKADRRAYLTVTLPEIAARFADQAAASPSATVTK